MEMDPTEEKVAKLYIAAILVLTIFAVVFGAVAKVQESHLASPEMTRATVGYPAI